MRQQHCILLSRVISAHFRWLEDKLGVKLFTKREGRFPVSDEGGRILAWAEDI